MTTPSLQQTLENFQAYVLQKQKAIEKQIIGETHAFKKERLEVYQKGYFLRLFEVLSKDFPVLKRCVGQKKFEKICQQYLKAFPSTHYSIRYVGQHLSDFLKVQPEIPAFWADMAAFEWALGLTVDAADAPYLALNDVSTLTPEQWNVLKLQLHPALFILQCTYEVPSLWQKMVQKKRMPKIALPLTPNPSAWLVWRFNRQTYFKSANEFQLEMIRLFQQGKTFAQVCEHLCESKTEAEVIPLVAQTLHDWIVGGIFSGFTIYDDK